MTEEPRDVPPPPSPAYPPPPPPAGGPGRTSTGLDPKLSGVLAYLFWIVGGILFLVTEKENQLVRFHAAQSVVFSAVGIVVWIVLTVLTNIPVLGLLFWIVSIVFWLLMLVVWLFLMYKAYQLERYKLPVLGDYAEKLAAKQL